MFFSKVFVQVALNTQKQVDHIPLDFCKAFDKVPHQRLLTKLKYYDCKAGGSGRAARAMALPHFRLSDHVTLNG